MSNPYQQPGQNHGHPQGAPPPQQPTMAAAGAQPPAGYGAPPQNGPGYGYPASPPGLPPQPGPGDSPVDPAQLSGYTSPIPIAPTGLGHALASEWTKIRSVRSTMWSLGTMIVLVVGIGLLMTPVLDDVSSYQNEPALGLGFTGTLLGMFCVITLGVLVISSEYGTGMIRTTFTACPSRARVLTAKALVFFGVVFVIATCCSAFVALIHSSVADGKPGLVEADGATWLRATAGAGLYVALVGLLALAVGAMLRHSAGAITTMMGLVLLPLLIAIFLASESLRDIRKYMIDYSLPSGLSAMFEVQFQESSPDGWTPLWILLAVTVAALAGAYALVTTRDV
ncbi:ABC transporter permease [Streptomyces sp. NPDC005438]|uniref:ABC transporter permease n=1 Tax=Streptomyces sp. NPDC005438 TaxID=3156880 RepID=UPI0033B45AB0